MELTMELMMEIHTMKKKKRHDDCSLLCFALHDVAYFLPSMANFESYMQLLISALL